MKSQQTVILKKTNSTPECQEQMSLETSCAYGQSNLSKLKFTCINLKLNDTYGLQHYF